MLSVSISLQPDGVGRRFQNIDMAEIVGPVLSKMGQSIMGASKQVTPVDTGLLRSSIGLSQSLATRGSFKIETDTHYARFVHDGTRFMKARPFFQWGVEHALRSWGAGSWNVRIDRELRKRLSSI